jgi:hypothetical protein
VVRDSGRKKRFLAALEMTVDDQHAGATGVSGEQRSMRRLVMLPSSAPRGSLAVSNPSRRATCFPRSLRLFVVPFLRVMRSVQSFRSYIDTVGPSERSPFDEKLFEKFKILKWRKYWTFEPLRNINVLLGSVIETS